MAYNDRNSGWYSRDDRNQNRDDYYDDNNRNDFRNEYNRRNYDDNTYNGGYNPGYNDRNRNDMRGDRNNSDWYNRTMNDRYGNDRRYSDRDYDDRRMNNDRWNNYQEAPSFGSYTGYAGQMGPTEGVPGFGTTGSNDRGYRDRNYNDRNYNTNPNNNSGRRNDRSWWDKASDEVSSWFGDDDAERRRQRDERQNHRGKGPKNYKRSEDRIMEDVCVRLSEHPDIDATDIMVTVDGDEVTLTGTIDSKQAKRKAEDVCESVSGVSEVHNQLRIRKDESEKMNSTITNSPSTTDASRKSSNAEAKAKSVNLS